MTRAASVLIYVAAVTTPTAARADEQPPCSDEADAVKNMQARDSSLAYPTKPSAKEHLEAGKRAFGVQQYDKAIEEYTAAGLADDAPLILYNLGQTYRSAKEYAKAIRQYELFLERGKPGPEVRALVSCHIATMKRELDHAASTAPPTGPAAEPSSTPPTRPAAQPSALSKAPTTTTAAQVQVASANQDKPEAKDVARWTSKRKIAVGLALGGVAVLGAGTVFAIQNQRDKADADRLCPSSPCANADEANALSDRAGTRATLANVSFGVGAGLVAGAVVLWLVGAPSGMHADSNEAAIIPQITPTFSGIAYSGRF
jgi:tetratricopeptide (TPR) repeat protein